jgi:S-adenosylmethionine hydrolase
MFNIPSSPKSLRLSKKAKKNLHATINTTIIDLYWNIGKTIQGDILKNKKAEYGEAVIKELGLSLTAEYGRGFGSANLFHMVKFYNTFTTNSIFYTVCRKLKNAIINVRLLIEHKNDEFTEIDKGSLK